MANMKAAQWDPKVNDMVVNEVPIPVPRENQFLVKIASASLCHSDIMAIETPDREEPITIGHEGVGHIVSFHPSAENKGFQTGDPVGFLYIIDCCFVCEGCLVHNLSCKTGKQLLQGFTTAGFFAEYAVVDYRNAVVLPPSLDLKTSAPIFCAGITAFHSVDSCNLKPGDWFCVIGCGGLGQLATQYAKAMGYKVVGIDINDTILSQCTAQGADAVFNSRTQATTYQAAIQALTGGGAHAVAVYSNAPAAYASAPSLIRLGGVLMVVGIPADAIPVSVMDLVLGRYRILAESTSIPRRMRKAVDFTAEHSICPDVEQRVGLESVRGMVQDMRRGASTKRMAVVF